MPTASPEASTENIAIGTEIAVVVSKIYVEIGSRVKTGDPLFTIDDRAVRAELAQRQAGVQVADASLAQATNQLALYDAHFDASWEIDVFGGKRRALESATAQLAAIAEDRRDVLVSVLAEVARNYVEVRGLQQRLAIARKNIKAQSEAVDITRARFNAGLTSELDVKQAEALVATTQSQLPTMETALKRSVHRLSVLLGQQPGALIAELSRDEPIPATPPAVPVGLPSELMRRRPDVRRADRQLASASANIGVETAELFPKFSLLGTGGFQSLSASDWFSGGSRYWSAGPTVNWRLLDFGRIRAQVKAANARQEQALAAYERTVLMSFEDVENALVAYMLGILKAAGALGLLVGIGVPLIGTAAAVGLLLFFVGAIFTHLRARDYSLGPAVVFLLLAVAALVLRLTTS